MARNCGSLKPSKSAAVKEVEDHDKEDEDDQSHDNPCPVHTICTCRKPQVVCAVQVLEDVDNSIQEKTVSGVEKLANQYRSEQSGSASTKRFCTAKGRLNG